MRSQPPEAVADKAAEEPFDTPVAAVPRTRHQSTLRRRLLWGGGTVVLLVLLVLTPPLVNVNRYRTRIAESMSRSLGRPVHLDNVSVHLLPVPGFTLQNLVVSEDPDFGAEPTIRANTVEATLRVSSLWHRPVEFSTVRFVEPSVNLVRNAEGRWNLSEVLLQASRVQSAPTDQRRAGPTPRFPYIEATGGRVNVKLGPEKLPFALTDTDFALWLPSAEQWRVRLVGHPARTDTNLTDPGTVRLEGELRRADTAMSVPVNFRASWHDAPLGEATRLLSGDDWGWRGALNLDATLSGKLGQARAAAKLTLGGLRRAEFFPARPLDLQITCNSGFMLHPGTLTELACTLPDGGPEPLTLYAASVDLQAPRGTSATLRGHEVPASWPLLWAALFSPRIPTSVRPAGILDVDLERRWRPSAPATPKRPSRSARRGSPRRLASVPAFSTAPGPWAGTLRLSLPTPGATLGGQELVWQLLSSPGEDGWPSLKLPPTPLAAGPGATVTLAGTVGEGGYTLSVNGTAPAAAVLLPARYLPQLGDGLDKVIPFPPTSLQPGRVQFTCVRTWNERQTCTGLESEAASQQPVTPARPPQARTPALLTPHSLSPFDKGRSLPAAKAK